MASVVPELHDWFGELVLITERTQAGIDFSDRPKASQLAGASGAPQRAGEDPREDKSVKSSPKPAGIAFTPLGQRQIGEPGVLAGPAPGGFAVARQVDAREFLAHGDIAKTTRNRALPLIMRSQASVTRSSG
jgi:hypothetical protein